MNLLIGHFIDEPVDIVGDTYHYHQYQDTIIKKFIELLACILMGHIFLLAGLNKIDAYQGTQAYMDSMGIPGALLPLVIALEIGGALVVIVGFKTRWAADSRRVQLYRV